MIAISSERTIAEGALKGGKRGKKSGRAEAVCVCAVKETSGTYFEVARHDFLHLLVHHADEFADGTMPRKNSAR